MTYYKLENSVNRIQFIVFTKATNSIFSGYSEKVGILATNSALWNLIERFWKKQKNEQIW